nr:hypothetical protein K-LCC10_0362 [Kaumoebavirus]
MAFEIFVFYALQATGYEPAPFFSLLTFAAIILGFILFVFIQALCRKK